MYEAKNGQPIDLLSLFCTLTQTHKVLFDSITEILALMLHEIQIEKQREGSETSLHMVVLNTDLYDLSELNNSLSVAKRRNIIISDIFITFLAT